MRNSRAPRMLVLITAAILAAPAARAAAQRPTPVPPATIPPSADAPPMIAREFRGAWVATVSNIDWPSRPGLTTWEQQAELLAIMNRAVALNLNAIVLQVRPSADALYNSPYEPWSAYLTGLEGRAPEPYYDPLAFAVEAAHARGLELHAWFNPYRARHSSAKGAAARTHISATRSALVKQYGGYEWMDPGEPAVRERTLRVMLDVVKRYDVDGIHIDDYFYPYPELGKDGAAIPFPDSASYAAYRRGGGTLERNDWRRSNVNVLIRDMYVRTKTIKPWVKVGISPFGIWRPGNPEQIGGFDAYAKLYADSRKWLREGWADYFTPQLYWPIAQAAQSYPVLLHWWMGENAKGRHLWIGHYTTRAATAWPSDELSAQIRASRAEGATGAIHFSMRALMERRDSLPAALAAQQAARQPAQQPVQPADTLAPIGERLRAGVYAEPALIPASPWLTKGKPAPPSVVVSVDTATGERVARLAPAGERRVVWWTVRAFVNGAWRSWILPGAQRRVVVAGAGVTPVRVLVTAVDRYGIESAVVEGVRQPRSQKR
jgi:uncharacterized lipoprotein YddW (UPF0748 family)